LGGNCGGLIGLLIGVLGGPLGVIVGGATGVLVGSLFDLDDADETESALAEISKSVRVNSPALLADVIEESPVAIDAAMANLGGRLYGEAIGWQRTGGGGRASRGSAGSEKKARKELHDARHKKQREEIDAKVADLRAKLDRGSQPRARELKRAWLSESASSCRSKFAAG
jgi:hypothetical protein